MIAVEESQIGDFGQERRRRGVLAAGVDAALTFTDPRKDGRILVLSFINCLARSSMIRPAISGSPWHPQVIL
jgi:hypothetical protein